MASDLRQIDPQLADSTFYICEYNGFRFDPAATETLSISCKAMQDEAGRTIKFSEFIIQLRTEIYIARGDIDADGNDYVTSDIEMDDLRSRLMSQGGKFIYNSKGFGTINVNVGLGGSTVAVSNPAAEVEETKVKDIGQWDVAWGPTPLGFSAKPIADCLGWEVTWGLKVCLPDCNDAVYQDAIMSFCYDVDYSTDYGGYTTRTIRGYIEVPMTRDSQGDRKVRHKTADDFRDSIIVQVPVGFRDAGGGSFRLSKDRRRLDFQFVHEQLPGIVPPLGVLKCSMSMKTQNVKRGSFVQWLFTISAEYEMAYGRFQQAAAVHFRRVVANRIVRLTRGVVPNPNGVNQGGVIAPGLADDPVGLRGVIDQIKKANGGRIPDQNPAKPVVGQPVGGVTTSGDGTVGGIVNKKPISASGLLVDSVVSINTKTTRGPSQAVNEGNPVAKGAAQVGDGVTDLALNEDNLNVLMLPPNCAVYPIFYSAEDPDAYGKPRAKFDCTLMVFRALPQLLTTGLWEPIKDTPPWFLWKITLGKIWDGRGSANMKFNVEDDLIIDLCQDKDKVEIANNKSGLKATQREEEDDTSGSSTHCGPEWLDFRNDMRFIQEENNVITKKLPTDSALDSSGPTNPLQTVPDRWFTNPGNKFNVSEGGLTSEEPTRFSDRVSPDYMVQMIGFSIKRGSSPLAPSLVSLGGVPAVPVHRVTHTEIIGNSVEPVYKTSWVLTYSLPQHVGSIAGGAQDSTGSLSSQLGMTVTAGMKSVGA